MKKGLVSSPFYPRSREDLATLLFSFEKLAENGMYDVLEFFYEGDASDYEVIGQSLAGLGIEPVLHPGFKIKRDLLDLGSSNLHNRKDSIRLCREFIDYCYICGARKMLVLSGPETAAGNDLDAYLDRFADSIRQLCAYAASAGESWQPEITLEFFNDTGEPYLAIGSLETILKLTDRLDDLNGQFGITYDTSHVIQLGGDLAEFYTSLRKYIRHIHFANCVTRDINDPLYGDKHPPFNIAGGDLTDNDIIQFMKSVDRDKIDLCSFEIIPGNAYDSAFCQQSLSKSLKKIFRY